MCSIRRVPGRVATTLVKILPQRPCYANRCSVLHNAVPILARTPNVASVLPAILILLMWGIFAQRVSIETVFLVKNEKEGI